MDGLGSEEEANGGCAQVQGASQKDGMHQEGDALMELEAPDTEGTITAERMKKSEADDKPNQYNTNLFRSFSELEDNQHKGSSTPFNNTVQVARSVSFDEFKPVNQLSTKDKFTMVKQLKPSCIRQRQKNKRKASRNLMANGLANLKERGVSPMQQWQSYRMPPTNKQPMAKNEMTNFPGNLNDDSHERILNYYRKFSGNVQVYNRSLQRERVSILNVMMKNGLSNSAAISSSNDDTVLNTFNPSGPSQVDSSLSFKSQVVKSNTLQKVDPSQNQSLRSMLMSDANGLANQTNGEFSLESKYRSCQNLNFHFDDKQQMSEKIQNFGDLRQEKIKKLESQLETSKLFMNMVIHDLRNPAESIHEGLKQAKELMLSKFQEIFLESKKMLQNEILNSQSHIIGNVNVSANGIRNDYQHNVQNFTSHVQQSPNTSQRVSSENSRQEILQAFKSSTPASVSRNSSQLSRGLFTDMDSPVAAQADDQNLQSKLIYTIPEDEKGEQSRTMNLKNGSSDIVEQNNKHHKSSGHRPGACDDAIKEQREEESKFGSRNDNNSLAKFINQHVDANQVKEQRREIEEEKKQSDGHSKKRAGQESFDNERIQRSSSSVGLNEDYQIIDQNENKPNVTRGRQKQPSGLQAYSGLVSDGQRHESLDAESKNHGNFKLMYLSEQVPSIWSQIQNAEKSIKRAANRVDVIQKSVRNRKLEEGLAPVRGKSQLVNSKIQHIQLEPAQPSNYSKEAAHASGKLNLLNNFHSFGYQDIFKSIKEEAPINEVQPEVYNESPINDNIRAIRGEHKSNVHLVYSERSDDFNFNEEAMNEESQGAGEPVSDILEQSKSALIHLPKILSTNDNGLVMKDVSTPEVKFVVREVYMDRQHKLTMDRGTSTDESMKKSEEFSKDFLIEYLQKKACRENGIEELVNDLDNYEKILEILKVPSGQKLPENVIETLELFQNHLQISNENSLGSNSNSQEVSPNRKHSSNNHSSFNLNNLSKFVESNKNQDSRMQPIKPSQRPSEGGNQRVQRSHHTTQSLNSQPINPVNLEEQKQPSRHSNRAGSHESQHIRRVSKLSQLGDFQFQKSASVAPNYKLSAKLNMVKSSLKLPYTMIKQQPTQKKQSVNVFSTFNDIYDSDLHKQQRSSRHNKCDSCYTGQPHLKKLKKQFSNQMNDQAIPERAAVCLQHLPLSNSCTKCLSISQHHLKWCNQIENLKNKMDLYLQNAIYSGYLISNMVNDLLDLAKMDKSNFNLDYEYFNMYEVVIEAFSIVSFQAQQKRINLFLLFDKSRPFVFKRIYNDKRRFLQIFLNFLSNSIKFTSFGGFIKIHLKIIEEQISDNSNLLNPSSKPSREETSREDSSVQSVMNELTFKKPNRTKSTLPVNLDQFNQATTNDILKYVKLQIIIEDNGAGISPEGISKLFVDYSKLNEHAQVNQKGTGLGLSICKKIVEQMDGKVHIQSELGQGSSFIITLQTRVLDKQVINIDRRTFSEKQKLMQFQKIDAFNFTDDFDCKFDEEPEENIRRNKTNSLGHSKQQAVSVESRRGLRSADHEIVLLPMNAAYKFKSILDQDAVGASGSENEIILQKLSHALHHSQSLQQSNLNSSKEENQLRISRAYKTFQTSDPNHNDNARASCVGTYSRDQSLKATASQQKSFFYRNQKRPQQRNQDELSSHQESSSHNYQPSADHSGRQISQKNIFEKNSSHLPYLKDRSNKEKDEKSGGYGIGQFADVVQQSSKPSVPSQPSRYAKSGDRLPEQIDIQSQDLAKKAPALSIDSDDEYDDDSESDDMAVPENFLLTKSLQILHRYKQKKLKILVANDEQFQLFIISNSLEIMTHIDRIDKAYNGQEALDLVRLNERNNHKRYYDMIFLDLTMPIKDGYEACKQIIQHYSTISFDQNSYESESDIDFKISAIQEQILLDKEAHSLIQQMRWVKDLKQVYHSYLKCIGKESMVVRSQSDTSAKQESSKILVIFRRLYKYVKYRALLKLERPWIFAYSAMVNKRTQQDTAAVGFDQCLSSPLRATDVQALIQANLDTYVENFIEQKLLNIQKEEKIFKVIKDKNLFKIDENANHMDRNSQEELSEIQRELFRGGQVLSSNNSNKDDYFQSNFVIPEDQENEDKVSNQYNIQYAGAAHQRQSYLDSCNSGQAPQVVRKARRRSTLSVPTKSREQKHPQEAAKLADNEFTLSADPQHHLAQKSSGPFRPNQLDSSQDEESSVSD